MTEYRLHGPPGTGKTRALSRTWVPQAAEKFGNNSVVICSLTKTAAAEIASRDLPIPRDNVGTLHAFAFRALDRPTIAEGEIKAWNEAEPVFAMSGARPSVDEPELAHVDRATKGDDLSARAQVLRHNRVSMAAWPDDVLAFQRRWSAWMSKEGLVDFTGLIEDALDAVPVAPGYPRVFIVDEAQDCSVLELDLVRKWAARAEYAVLAGDGDQAIYGWRGASARAFLDPDIPDDNNYHLTQSYRVPRAAHKVATSWIRQASYRYAVDYEPRDVDGEVVLFEGNGKNVKPVVDAAWKDAEAGRSVMILASCGYMLRSLIAVMRREGIPFHNEYRPTHGGWNPLRGGTGRLLAFLRPDPATYPTDFSMWTWKQLQAWVEVIRAKGVLAPSGKTYARQLAKDDERRNDAVAPEEGEAVFGASWWQLRDAFASGEPIDWLVDRLLASKAKLMQYPVAIAEKRGRPALRDKPRITIGTIHSVKGGEADVVYLMPDLSPSGMREWTRPGEARDGIVRTFYVGMTRAKQKLVLCGRWSPASVDWKTAARG